MRKDDLSGWGGADDNGKPSREERLRRIIDSWVGTLIQIIAVVMLLYAFFIDRFHNPALLPGATGLFLLKNVAGRK